FRAKRNKKEAARHFQTSWVGQQPSFYGTLISRVKQPPTHFGLGEGEGAGGFSGGGSWTFSMPLPITLSCFAVRSWTSRPPGSAKGSTFPVTRISVLLT